MYRITRALSVGRFATPERAIDLRAAGVTHVLNVCDSPNQVGCAVFREVGWHPLPDFGRIPDDVALAALDDLHRMTLEPDAHVYVHCMAGQLRSPTVLWLYLVACGLDPDAARAVLAERAPAVTPGANHMVGPGLVLTVQRHGRDHYLPHPRPDVLVPVEPT
jgi:hypothetical protein